MDWILWLAYRSADWPPAPSVVPGVGRLTVSPDDADVLTFLGHVLLRRFAVLPVFADWLADRDDARAALVRDLATPACVPPAPFSREERPMLAGLEWSASRCAGGVHSRIYPGSRLAAVIAFVRDQQGPFVHYEPVTRRAQTPASLLAALDRIRVRVLTTLFFQYRRRLQARRLLDQPARIDRWPMALIPNRGNP